MKNKINKIKFNWLLAASLIMLMVMTAAIPNANAIGITPGRTTIDFEPGLEKEIYFSVLNNEHKNMQAVFLLQGELNASVTLFDSSAEFMPSEESKQFRYKIKLPDRLEPGLHTAEIVAFEVPKLSQGGTYVGAAMAVVSQLYVYVACPGKCIDTSLNVLDAEQNSTATFIVPVINRGKVGIGEARAIIDVYTALNERVASIETDAWPVDAGARTELSAKWDVNVNAGNYLAKVTVFYDGESKAFEKEFGIGKNLLTIESILVHDFTLGEIAKLQILVENRWSQEFKGVFANLLVYNRDSQIMADVKSAAEDIPALSRKELVAYWDTVGIEEGVYDGKLMVKYGKKSADRNLVLKITENSLDISGVGYAIRPRGGKGIQLSTILFVIVIILLVVNLAWFVFFRRLLWQKGGKAGEKREASSEKAQQKHEHDGKSKGFEIIRR